VRQSSLADRTGTPPPMIMRQSSLTDRNLTSPVPMISRSKSLTDQALTSPLSYAPRPGPLQAPDSPPVIMRQLSAPDSLLSSPLRPDPTRAFLISPLPTAPAPISRTAVKSEASTPVPKPQQSPQEEDEVVTKSGSTMTRKKPQPRVLAGTVRSLVTPLFWGLERAPRGPIATALLGPKKAPEPPTPSERPPASAPVPGRPRLVQRVETVELRATSGTEQPKKRVSAF
jgi:hypothetical protein